jgi:phage terminase large subunit-like protein
MATATLSKPVEIHLLDGQAALLTDFTSSVLAAIAGTGGGKTILGYWWLHSRMEAYPGNTWAMAEPTYNMLSKIILVSSDPARPTLERYLADIGHHPHWISKQDQIIGTDFGQIYLGSADNPDSMQGPQ